MTCPTHKKVFLNETIAEEALLNAWIIYAYKNGQGPIAVYKCDECLGYHFTSKGSMNRKLADRLRDGEIDKRRDQQAWIEKLKNKGKL